MTQKKRRKAIDNFKEDKWEKKLIPFKRSHNPERKEYCGRECSKIRGRLRCGWDIQVEATVSGWR